MTSGGRLFLLTLLDGGGVCQDPRAVENSKSHSWE